VEPRRIKKAGRELGNAAAAAALCVDPRTGRAITAESFQWYVARSERLARKGRPLANPAPTHVEVDNKTEQRMYPLKEVRAWHATRQGRGNWRGIGARAGAPDQGVPAPGSSEPSAVCNYCARTVLVEGERMARHGTSDTRRTKSCAGSGERAPVRAVPGDREPLDALQGEVLDAGLAARITTAFEAG
jgi:hypothetical protein